MKWGGKIKLILEAGLSGLRVLSHYVKKKIEFILMRITGTREQEKEKLQTLVCATDTMAYIIIFEILKIAKVI